MDQQRGSHTAAPSAFFGPVRPEQSVCFFYATRVLSRELLYTAHTRHQHRVVLLVQGDATALRGYAGDAASETARRLTNLFTAPAPVRVNAVRYDDKHLHRTARGELVLSKSEVIIANELFRL